MRAIPGTCAILLGNYPYSAEAAWLRGGKYET